MNRDPLEALLQLRRLETRRIAGVMSGTSADGIDVAIVEVRSSGVDAQIETLASGFHPYADELQQRLWALVDGTARDVCELNFLLGDAFAAAIAATAASAELELATLDLVGSHGQTARHQARGLPGVTPSTLQIGEAAVIAERTGLPVICDFRVADVAAGGHGAPLIPLVDHLLFRRPDRAVGLLNLGGIANLTVVTPDRSSVTAFDTGPANMPLDAVARAASSGRESYDDDGALARRGRVDRQLLDELMRHRFFSHPPPRTAGREQFGEVFVGPLIERFADRLADLMATLVALVAESIGLAVEQHVQTASPGALAGIYVSGGGVHNSALMGAIERRLAPLEVSSTAELGVDPDAKEAIGFAVLANETLFCNPGNIPAATGAHGPRILGKIALPTG